MGNGFFKITTVLVSEDSLILSGMTRAYFGDFLWNGSAYIPCTTIFGYETKYTTFFYNTLFDKSHEPEICQNSKNKIRDNPA